MVDGVCTPPPSPPGPDFPPMLCRPGMENKGGICVCSVDTQVFNSETSKCEC